MTKPLLGALNGLEGWFSGLAGANGLGAAGACDEAPKGFAFAKGSCENGLGVLANPENGAVLLLANPEPPDGAPKGLGCEPKADGCPNAPPLPS